MRPIKTLFAAASLMMLAACASTQEMTLGDLEFELPAPTSSYGLFLAGQAALNDGKSQEASDYFMRASVGGSQDGGFLKERAFTAAVLAGDVGKAASLAPGGDVNGNTATYRLGRLVRGVEALAQNKGRDARQLLTAEPIGFPHRAAAALLTPWASAAAGDTEGSLVRPEVPGDKVVEYFGQLGQAFLFERARRYDEAETDFKALTGLGDVGSLFMLDYGGFLERRGRWDDAIALYESGLMQEPGDRELTAARTRAYSRRNPQPAPSLREGAAKALIAPAAAMIAERQAELALAYLRLALRLDPTRDEAWVLVGDVMNAADDAAAAREAYSRVSSGSPNYSAARAKMAWSYQLAGQKDEALKMAADAVAADPQDRDAAITQADLLRANDRYADAAKVLDALIAGGDGSPDWRLLYMRGVALERSGRWDEAEKDLTKALEQQPDEPELLNYLGYTWIDRGERLQEAMDMVRRASEANPRSGAMVDSLGWAYYRLGDYKSAVEKLERAVELEPADPEINDHLGDAYWRVGRRIEAEFQWRRVLTLEPPEAIRARVDGKLKSGLGAPETPVVGKVVAER